jgi:hypothetical protein
MRLEGMGRMDRFVTSDGAVRAGADGDEVG